MSFKIRTELLKSNGFRLFLWYTISFVIGSAILLFATYLTLSSALKNQDKEAIQSELDELVSKYNYGGLETVDREISDKYQFRKKNPFFIRIAESSNQTVKIYYPHIWNEFDLSSLDTISLRKDLSWINLSAIDEDFELAAAAKRLKDSRWLQVGISSEDRERILGRYRAIMVTIFLPVAILAVIGGSLLALRSLKPVRGIVKTAQSILDGQMEARVIRSYNGDELDELARLFNEMLDKIKRLIETLKDSLDNVAHDLRTPMTRLRSVAEKALQDGRDIKQAKEALSDCVEEADRILAMLTILMDIAEAETGALNLDRQLLNIRTLLDNVIDMYEPVADEKQIQLTILAADELYTICDGNRMSQALANLLDNAIKYTPKGGRVDIEAHQEKGEFCVLFTDTGPGIEHEDLTKIWDRLFRSENARSQKGLGLGLSFVKAICEAHGGHVSVSSTPGKGSIFKVTLSPDFDTLPSHRPATSGPYLSIL